MRRRTAIVIGSGIAGLATARALAIKGYGVTIIERNATPLGASIRNFGMIWPIGQPDGEPYEEALRSRSIWKEICVQAQIWHHEAGCLHVANSHDEVMVLQELADIYQHRDYAYLSAEAAMKKSSVVIRNIKGALYSPHEMIVDPRRAISQIVEWLKLQHGVNFIIGKTVVGIEYPVVYAGNERWEADEIFVCSGSDFETLYPDIFAKAPLTKCKLQMLRLPAQPDGERIGPAVCGCLSLIHYKAFKAASSLHLLQERYRADFSEELECGIHVMVAQHESGELTVGDSHEYGLTPLPFNQQRINDLIINYLRTFARFRDERVIETWNGVYAKMTNDDSYFVAKPKPGITIINGFGGAGMTLSFGVCEKNVSRN